MPGRGRTPCRGRPSTAWLPLATCWYDPSLTWPQRDRLASLGHEIISQRTSPPQLPAIGLLCSSMTCGALQFSARCTSAGHAPAGKVASAAWASGTGATLVTQRIRARGKERTEQRCSRLAAPLGPPLLLVACSRQSVTIHTSPKLTSPF